MERNRTIDNLISVALGYNRTEGFKFRCAVVVFQSTNNINFCAGNELIGNSGVALSAISLEGLAVVVGIVGKPEGDISELCAIFSSDACDECLNLVEFGGNRISIQNLCDIDRLSYANTVNVHLSANNRYGTVLDFRSTIVV